VWRRAGARLRMAGCVALVSSTGSGDGVANSGDGSGGSNGEESERETGASSGREEGERAWCGFYRGEGGRGEGGRGRERYAGGFFMVIDASVSWRKNVGRE
jgi:hypothetical protein